MIDWKMPIETVPDEKNPTPAKCSLTGFSRNGAARVLILDDWFDRHGCNYRDQLESLPWLAEPDTGHIAIGSSTLIRLRNVEQSQ